MSSRHRRGGVASAVLGCLAAGLVGPLAVLAVLAPVGPPAVLPLATGSAAPVPSAVPSAVPSPAALRMAPGALRAAPAPSPEPVVVERGDGVTVVVPVLAGAAPAAGTGPVRTFTVEVEGGLGVDAAAFAREVEGVLTDERSWGARGRLAFRRVGSGAADVRVLLTSPQTTDRLCRPLDTGGRLSCANEGRAVLNALRWLRGADSYAGDLAGYRQYVVNHEVGHLLGHGHERCPTSGAAAPVMVQQTLGLQGCRRNPWPYPG